MENDNENSLSGKTKGIWKICQNTGNLVDSKSICKFSKSNTKWYYNTCSENFLFFPYKLNVSTKSDSLMGNSQITEFGKGKI